MNVESVEEYFNAANLNKHLFLFISQNKNHIFQIVSILKSLHGENYLQIVGEKISIGTWRDGKIIVQWLTSFATQRLLSILNKSSA